MKPEQIVQDDEIDCQNKLHPSAIRGLQLIQQGSYWEAHEALEEAWLAEPGEGRRLYQTILQAAVVYHHVLRGNYIGALKVYQRSQRWLRRFPEVCRGIEVGQLRRDLDVVIIAVRSLGVEHLADFDRDLLMPVIWAL